MQGALAGGRGDFTVAAVRARGGGSKPPPYGVMLICRYSTKNHRCAGGSLASGRLARDL